MALVVPEDLEKNRETLTFPPPPLPQESDSQTCPFCRSQIKGREVVSIHQSQGRPAEARAAAMRSGSRDGQENGEEALGQVSRARRELELKFLGLR